MCLSVLLSAWTKYPLCGSSFVCSAIMVMYKRQGKHLKSCRYYEDKFCRINHLLLTPLFWHFPLTFRPHANILSVLSNCAKGISLTSTLAQFIFDSSLLGPHFKDFRDESFALVNVSMLTKAKLHLWTRRLANYINSIPFAKVKFYAVDDCLFEICSRSCHPLLGQGQLFSSYLLFFIHLNYVSFTFIYMI